MIRGLIEKELRQHGMSLGFLLAIYVAGLALLTGNHNLSRLTGTPLESLHLLLLLLVPLSGLFLGQVLVASEFRHKTQLFLEGLPLPRWWMLTVKFALGLLVLLIGITASFGLLWKQSRGVDALNLHFTTILALKAVLWTCFAYSCTFAHGFLGRYRVIVGILIVAGLASLNEHGVPIGEFPPFHLVDQRFAYERIVLPTEDLLLTAGACVVFVAIAFSLGLMRDATIASMLAERMSSREKLVLTFLGIAAIMSFSYLSEQRIASTPVIVPGSFDVERGPARVSVSAAVDAPLSGEITTSKRIANHIADDLAAMATYLGCTTLPPVFIVHRRDFTGDQMENGNLTRKQGLMVKTNLMARDFHEEALRDWLVREILLLKSSQRADLEKNAWVLDGFPLWWRQVQGGQPAPSQHPPELSPARTAMPADFSSSTVERWLLLRKNAGQKAASDLAWTGLAILAEKHGADACRRFLSAMLSRDVPEDARGWLRDELNSMPRRFEKATSTKLDVFAHEWKSTLENEAKTETPASP